MVHVPRQTKVSNLHDVVVSNQHVPSCDVTVYALEQQLQLLLHLIQQQLESSHSPQVPPPRQSYSPGGVTIFALPAVPLCPFNAMVTKISIQNPGSLPDHAQN